MLNTVHEPDSLPEASNETNFMPLGWNGRNSLGFQTMLTGACGCSTSSMATSVMCPLPVAARLPYSVTSKRAAPEWLARNISAALRGAMVWLLDGPVPMR